MALSADTPIDRRSGDLAVYPVAASSAIYAGSLVGMKNDGYVRALSAGDRFVGHAWEGIASQSADGTRNVQVLTGRYRVEVTLTTAITDVGKAVWATDDATFVIDPANGASSRVGKVAEYVDGTTTVVEFDTNYVHGLVYSLDAAGTALTNSTTATALATCTIPASALQVGDVIRVRAAVIATAATSSDTFLITYKVGTESVKAGTATNATANDIMYLDADTVVRAVGASGSICSAGLITTVCAAEGTATALPFLDAAATEATNVDVPVAIYGTWSAADSGNSARCDIFNVQILRQGIL